MPRPLDLLFPVVLALGMSACVSAVASESIEDSSASGWRPVWSDEFDGDTIDIAKWERVVDCWGGGNEERQCYTDKGSNAHVADGKLVITAIQENASGAAWPPHMRQIVPDPDATATKPYTSAKLVTKGKANWKYGKIEVRAKLPQGQGVWPAIWMLPEDNVYGPWAMSGEIDILEAVNLGVECADCEEGGENTILGTLHFGGAWPENLLASTEVSRPAVLDGFHTYGVIWEPGRFRWTFDGEIYAEQVAGDWSTTGSNKSNAPFDQPFYLILNLAIGGKLPEGRAQGGVSEKHFPKVMEVDWVRVWQCSGQSVTAEGCVGSEGKAE